ncbi:MAG: TolC family protein [Nitrospirae bacterium]|nr:TolC family protein [Nitrospirota bacterium]
MTGYRLRTFFIFLLLMASPATVFGNDLPSHGSDLTLSLSQTIGLALKNNLSLKNVYRDRIVQRFDLKVAEDKFFPRPVLVTSAGEASAGGGGTTVKTKTAGAALSVSETVPTGGRINLSLAEVLNRTDGSGTVRDRSWSAAFAQPLLKGGGIDVTTASVRTARINEEVNVLSLKAATIDLVSSVITAYRTYLQAGEQLDITRQSVRRATDLVMINRELINAGRMAEVELFQTEADVANREFSLLEAENNLDSARLSLIKLLDIDKRTRITPSEKVSAEPVGLDYEAARKTALENRPDYRSSLLRLEISKMNVMLAKNNMLWDLSLTGGFDGVRSGPGSAGADGTTRSWNMGLKLTVPFRDLTLEQGYISAKIGLEKDETNLLKLRETIEIEVQDIVRNVEMRLRQVKLASQARVLSEKKLEIETEKLKAGRSTNFQLVSYQNDLVNAQSSELAAVISYQNALAEMDRTLGTTLERWGIILHDAPGAEK